MGLLRERIKVIDESREYRFNLLNALHLLRRSWDEIKPETIKNCFRHAAFLISDETEAGSTEIEESTDGILETWESLKERGGIDEHISMEDFVNIDKEVITGGALSLAEIVDDCLETDENGDNEPSDCELMEENEEEVEDLPVTILEAQRALQIVRQYVEKNFDDPITLRLTDGLDEAFYQKREKKQKQSRLTDFFKPDQ